MYKCTYVRVGGREGEERKGERRGEERGGEIEAVVVTHVRYFDLHS